MPRWIATPGDAGLAMTEGEKDAATGLPGLRTWPAVYIFVLGVFVVWVVLLTVLTEKYS